MDFMLRTTTLKWCLYLWAFFNVTGLCFIPYEPIFGQRPLASTAEPTPKQVAVIGAGAAGASTAYYLRKNADSLGIPVNITVFERASHVGGRSTTVNVFDNPAYPIELGASIFVNVNEILVNATKEFGLNVQSSDYNRPQESNDILGVWDGEQFVLVIQDSYSWWNTAKLLWRYGLAPIRTRNLMRTTVNKFLELYKKPIFPFSSLTAAAGAVGLLDTTSAPGSTFLSKNNISPSFAREIIQASTRVNYGQNLPLIHGLESMVCMATDGAVAVEGGNWHIFYEMLKSSQADIRVNNTVTSIEQNDQETLTVGFHDDENPSKRSLVFDEVVLAGPFQYSGIDITPPLEHSPDKVPFVTLYVTLFSSPHRLSPKYFNLRDSEHAPTTILTTLPAGTDLGSSEKGVGPSGFWSISTLRTVESPEAPSENHYVYKIFSPERPTAKFMRDILSLEHDESDKSSTIGDLPKGDISWFYEKIWNPYPFLYPRLTFEEISLAPNVWYTGGIESFISTMETSALMGMNVAGLISESWQEQKLHSTHGVDQIVL